MKDKDMSKLYEEVACEIAFEYVNTEDLNIWREKLNGCPQEVQDLVKDILHNKDEITDNNFQEAKMLVVKHATMPLYSEWENEYNEASEEVKDNVKKIMRFNESTVKEIENKDIEQFDLEQ